MIVTPSGSATECSQFGVPPTSVAAGLVESQRRARDDAAIRQGLDPNVHCMPRGAPRIWTDDYYKRIFMGASRIRSAIRGETRRSQRDPQRHLQPDHKRSTHTGAGTGVSPGTGGRIVQFALKFLF